jgi:non-ribosomal peptide synthetase component E (peptide arylation enzyme)
MAEGCSALPGWTILGHRSPQPGAPYVPLDEIHVVDEEENDVAPAKRDSY